MVRIVHEYTGRGPTGPARRSVTTSWSFVLQEILAESRAQPDTRSGKGELVVEMRRSFQQTSAKDLTAAVEMLTERKVIAFMSDSQLEPDYSVEVFVLAPRTAG